MVDGLCCCFAGEKKIKKNEGNFTRKGKGSKENFGGKRKRSVSEYFEGGR